eukprot:15225645-Alexandrium_andersonii.AAC.1
MHARVLAPQLPAHAVPSARLRLVRWNARVALARAHVWEFGLRSFRHHPVSGILKFVSKWMEVPDFDVTSTLRLD